MSEFSYDPNDPNNPTSAKEVNTNINNSSDYLKTTSSLPKPPVCNIGICATPRQDLSNRKYRAEFYFVDKCIRLASSHKFDYDTLANLEKEFEAKNIETIKNICQQHDIYICHLKFYTEQIISDIINNYHGIPIHSHFTLENATILGKFEKSSFKAKNSLFRLKKCKINSELELYVQGVNFTECDFQDGIKIHLECLGNVLIKDCILPKKENMQIEITGNAASLVFYTNKEESSLIGKKIGGKFDTRRLNLTKERIIFYETNNVNYIDLENDATLLEKPYTVFGNIFDTDIPYTGFAKKEQIAFGFDLKRERFSYGYSLDVNLKHEILTINSNAKLEFEDRKKLYIALENNDFESIDELCNKFDLKISCLEFKERQNIGKIRDGYRGIPLDSRFKIINCCFTEESTLYCWHTDILLQNCKGIELAGLSCKSIKSIS